MQWVGAGGRSQSGPVTLFPPAAGACTLTSSGGWSQAEAVSSEEVGELLGCRGWELFALDEKFQVGTI